MSSKKRRTSTQLPLQGVRCWVDARNEDGSDASSAYVTLLKKLGATVEDGITAGLTHMIWARANLNLVKAAECLNICVVSPLWVEQCREAGSRVSESDFLVNADGSVCAPPQSMEPKVNHASPLTSPTMNSSQVDAAPSKNRSRKAAAPKKNVTAAPPPPATSQSSSSSAYSTAVTSAAQVATRKRILRDDSSSSDSEEEIFQSKSNRPATSKASVAKIASTSVPKTVISVSLTSFSSSDRAMLCDILTALQESSSIRLIDDEDYSLAALSQCTVVVAPKTRANRTVRVLFAMACGVPIVTEDFVHSSLEIGACQVSAIPKHLHPRFKTHKNSTQLLSDRRVYIGPCLDPPVSVVADLIKVLGGTRVEVLADSDTVIVEGNSGKNNGAVQRMKDFRQNLTVFDQKHLDALSLGGSVITTKSLFDSIEFGGSLKSKPAATSSSATPVKQTTANKVTSNAKSKPKSASTSAKKAVKKSAVVTDSSDDDFGSPTPPSKKVPRKVVSTRLPRKSAMPSPIASLSKSHVLDDDSEGEADLSYVINVPQQDGSPSW